MDSSSLFSFLNKQLSPAIIDRYLELLADNQIKLKKEIVALNAKNHQLQQIINEHEYELISPNTKINEYTRLLDELKEKNMQLQETVKSYKIIESKQNEENIEIQDKFNRFEEIISNLDEMQTVRLSVPENCYYYPKKHELIIINKRERASYAEIDKILEKIIMLHKDKARPIWFNSIYSLINIPELTEYQYFWARNQLGIVLVNNEGLKIQMSLLSHMHHTYKLILIPAVPLSADSTFLTYVLKDGWQVHQQYPLFDVTQSLLLSIGLNKSC